jgi:16S rRNA (adenine1518-N6/adenine1519-N6)-dimethyltransferase
MQVQAKKMFGQNFITDKNLILKIISLLKNDGNTLVIEIGPGQGALTVELTKQFKKVIAIEIDRDMEAILKDKIKTDNFDLVMEDVLEIDFLKLLKPEIEKYKSIVLISNTPYYITSEILFRTFDLSPILSQAIFMFQKEVAERVCAKVGDKKYNNLSIATEFYSKSKYEFTVKKNMFNPVPKVDSAIVSLDFGTNKVGDIKNAMEFVNFVRKLFNNRRKTILNNVKSSILGYDASKLLAECEIDSQLRPENLSIDQYIKLYKRIK